MKRLRARPSFLLWKRASMCFDCFDCVRAMLRQRTVSFGLHDTFVFSVHCAPPRLAVTDGAPPIQLA
jgi:hypothetical protein